MRAALENRRHRHHRSTSPQSEQESSYPRFALIDGSHPFKTAVPGGCVEYRVRTRHGGRVVSFNFDLAKEMGLIPADAPHAMTPALEKAILDTFAIQIINEYDILHKTPIPEEDIRPNTYMATRYLQLQHPDKKGTTSGDGRSIWNGCIRHKGTTWDVSSCGTGATCLSPATAIEGRYFKTGSTLASYGCGLSDVTEGLSAALMSNVFHKNGIVTERNLCVIEFKQGRAINVRAAKNLLRPSHFFHHLKQGNIDRLRAAVDYFVARQIANGELKDMGSPEKNYREMGKVFANAFGKALARFEADYIFVWLDWDGDNVLMDSGIIDYGSVRQFGLFHHEYRYDDVQRFSTTIPEQKLKARELVQTIAQMIDYLIEKKRSPKSQFANDSLVKLFDAKFEAELYANLLYKIGLSPKQRDTLLTKHRGLVRKFKKIHSLFEKAKSSRGHYVVGDGVTCDAVYCMRDLQRELPKFFLRHKKMPNHTEFMEMMASSYAKPKDKKLTPKRRKQIDEFCRLYLNLMQKVTNEKSSIEGVFSEVVMRSSVINMADRITGDAIISVTQHLVKNKRHFNFEELHAVMESFVETQRCDPARATKEKQEVPEGKPLRVLQKMLSTVRALRDGI